MLQGGLFTRYFLGEGIKETHSWKELGDEDVAVMHSRLTAILTGFINVREPNEHQTEDDLICKVLDALGWEGLTLRQQNLSAKGRMDIPDFLLFPDADAKANANTVEEWRRYALGVAIVESKRWLRQLDRLDALADEKNTVPSTQMVRYLRRLGDITGGKVRWGILTNGRHWRLYWEGATSIAEGFLELDLAALLGLPGFQPALSDISADDLLRVFVLIFRRQAFLPGAMGQTFHQEALEEGKRWEDRVSTSLSGLVFGHIFPRLVEGIATHDPEFPKSVSREYLDCVRDGALILLYRLLFILYAEDRNLLPARDAKYDDYGMGKKVRDDIANRIDGKDSFAAEAGSYYNHLKVLFRLVDKGGESIGLPPYNGGLFDPVRTPILNRIELPDRLFAPLIDRLSRHDDQGMKRRINYRDLSVQQLGSIYERLLENELVFTDGAVKIVSRGVV